MSNPTALSDTEFVVREFLNVDPAAPAAFVQGLLSTEDDPEMLQIESVLTLGDGQHSATFDFSVFASIDSPEAREERIEDIQAAAALVSALRKHVNTFLDNTMDALLEGLQVVQSYGDDVEA